MITDYTKLISLTLKSAKVVHSNIESNYFKGEPDPHWAVMYATFLAATLAQISPGNSDYIGLTVSDMVRTIEGVQTDDEAEWYDATANLLMQQGIIVGFRGKDYILPSAA